MMGRAVKIAPSMLAADFSRLGEEVRRAADAGADWIHLDVMDGHFVPNLTMGPRLIKSIRGYTDRPFDVHLMLTHPGDYVEAFVDAGADLITVHVEVNTPADELIDQIKALGVKAGLALRPATPVSAVEPYLREIDLVLPMSVEPGFGGQAFQMHTLDKIADLRWRAQDQQIDVEIEVDGGVNLDIARLVGPRGATVLVAGTAIFGHAHLRQAVAGLREAALL